MEPVTILKVRKAVTRGKYIAYKYKVNGDEYSFADIEACEKIKFIFGPNMTQEDIDIVKEKWKHKTLDVSSKDDQL